MRLLTRSLIFVCMFLLFSLPRLPADAQLPTDLTCPAIVEQALSQLGTNCSGLERNSACYGYTRVDATFSQTVPDEFFTQPADKTELVSLQTIETAPLDTTLSEWGVAVMNVQADVPDTLPGQAVTFLLLGDTQVENAVAAGEIFTGPVTAIIQAAADLRANPAADAPVVGQLPAGTVLEFDSTSPDRAWLHVTTDLGSGWISSEAVNQTAAISSLPIEGGARSSPMQAFYFRNGITALECQEAPSVLAVQSPDNITVNLTVNGADIRLGSLVTLKTLPGDIMQVTTIEGNAIIDPDGPNPISVPAGFTTTHCLDTPENLGSDGEANDQEIGSDCAWEQPREASLEEIGQGLIVQTMFEELGLERPVISVTPTPTDECPAGTTIVHTVSPGENLYRIGLRYRTGMGAIMSANGITNPQLIFAGQQLVIPCGIDTGLPSVPPTLVITTTAPATFPVDCSRFRATSPLDGLSYGSVTFYWDGAPGATGYQVNIYNLDEKNGALVGTFSAPGTATNLTADTSIESIGYGFSFAWEVVALYNGQVSCASIRYTVPRAPQPAPARGTLTATWTCVSAGTLAVSYGNVPAGDTSVTIDFIMNTGIPAGGTFGVPPSSGTQTFTGVFTANSGSVTSSPSGSSVTLAPASLVC
jgi:LysM repeat protein